MLSQRSIENRIILREEWLVVQNNKEILYDIKYCKCILRYWWDEKIKEPFRDWENFCGKWQLIMNTGTGYQIEGKKYKLWICIRTYLKNFEIF